MKKGIAIIVITTSIMAIMLASTTLPDEQDLLQTEMPTATIHTGDLIIVGSCKPFTHTVQSGETLNEISFYYGYDDSYIIRIYNGLWLTIPSPIKAS